MFCASNDIKNIQFAIEMRENLKVFDDRIPFVVYPSCNLLVQASLSLVRPRPKLIIYLG
jgi:hypothetical protein